MNNKIGTCPAEQNRAFNLKRNTRFIIDWTSHAKNIIEIFPSFKYQIILEFYYIFCIVNDCKINRPNQIMMFMVLFTMFNKKF